jgi:heat shock protein HtpX
MELCVDNPRSGFVDLFATHPSIERRIDALIKFAGGHDPGPIALAPPPPADAEPPTGEPAAIPAEGSQAGQPFLPAQSPLAAPETGQPGPWGEPRR